METPEDLTRSILKRTSGLACGRSREYLPDFVDGKLETGSAGLLALHLCHCSGCRALDQSLRELSEAFQGMALLEPDTGFTNAVMRATVKRYSVSSFLRFRGWWVRQIRRPRFALEAAYIGTLLCVLIIGNPASLVGKVAALQVKTGKSPGGVSQFLPAFWDRSEGEVSRVSRNISHSLSSQAGTIGSSVRCVGKELRETIFGLMGRGFGMARHYYSKVWGFVRRFLL
jgi:hypothetical protein